MLLEEYVVVEGECRIQIIAESRSAEASFDMLDTEERFYFTNLPSLDAYSKSGPYYCEITVTKDYIVEISYKIFDVNSHELLFTSE